MKIGRDYAISFLSYPMSDIGEITLQAFQHELEKNSAPLQAALGALKATPGVVSRFGQRQLHGLTGWTSKGWMSPEGIRAMRGGAYGAEQELGKAWAADKPKGLGRAVKGVLAAREAERMGLSSIPGYAKAMVKEGPAKTLSTGFKEQWHSTPTGLKMLLFGLPAANVAKELTTPTREGGPGKGQRVGQALALGAPIGPLSLSGQLATSAGLTAGVKGVSGLAGRLKKKPIMPESKEPPQQTEASTGMTQPTERVVSPAAAGQIPDGLASS